MSHWIKIKILCSHPTSRTPFEKEILELLPPGTLTYLATTGCDDEAMRRPEFKAIPGDTEMVEISMLKKVSAFNKLGWVPFDSSQL